MLDALDFPLAPESLVREVAHALRQGPWCWPDPDDPRFARALDLVPEGPRPVRPGEVLLVSTSAHGTTLWRFDLALAGPFALGPDARRAWFDAVAAACHSIPILWHPLVGVHRLPLVKRVCECPGRAGEPPPVSLVDGPSFGLSFALAVASGVLDDPVPGDLAASARIQPDGAVHPVGDIARKVRCVARVAPRVHRFLVARDNEAEAREAAAEAHHRLAVVPVTTVADAIVEAFGDGWADRLLDRQDPAETAAHLYALVHPSAPRLVTYRPVIACARKVADRLRDGPRDGLFRVQFALALAERHQSNRGAFPDLDEAVLDAMPTEDRVLCVANALQHSADTGHPSPEDAIRLARRALEGQGDLYVPHLRILAALGRLLWVLGRFEEALAHEVRAVEGFLRWQWDGAGNLSRPLAAALRLAGALRDEAALERAVALCERTSILFEPLDENPFVALAYGAGSVLAGRRDPMAIESLRALASLQEPFTADRVTDHVRCSAVRFLAWARPAEREDLVAILDAEADRGNADGRLFRALARLDEGDASAIGEVEAADPAVVTHLRTAHARDGRGLEWPEYLARFYPY